ncbi:hypothetical protein FHT80_006841 [Rhizobium sp. BK226]|uniref:hypothetical protein n=1 Tax=unclassified Rhizobium TaxID=2613769 RepID=UPI0014412071|nr:MULTISPECIES: hypothetical protein [unclassified Rhizobium]MBB3747353.1 hypothetical protein [Rhizobium sp. BK591]MBB4117453.1 hypothetical protein [Rhizobium sp. BK226]
MSIDERSNEKISFSELRLEIILYIKIIDIAQAGFGTGQKNASRQAGDCRKKGRVAAEIAMQPTTLPLSDDVLRV